MMQNPGSEPRHLIGQEGPARGDFISQKLHAAESVVAPLWRGENAKFRAVGIQRMMTSEQFRHALVIPQRFIAAGDGRHEAVGRLMEREVLAVVLEFLFIHPELESQMSTMIESGNVFPQHPGCPKAIRILHEVAGDLEFRAVGRGRERSEVGGESVVELVHEDRESPDFFLGDIGEQAQPAGFEAMNSQFAQACFVVLPPLRGGPDDAIGGAGAGRDEGPRTRRQEFSTQQTHAIPRSLRIGTGPRVHHGPWRFYPSPGSSRYV